MQKKYYQQMRPLARLPAFKKDFLPQSCTKIYTKNHKDSDSASSFQYILTFYFKHSGIIFV
ncbi:hypothetical protein DC498_09635 [Terrimonas sp.]|nr:hypothetical protein DC498_09635 [Terrimonas sp.]